VAVNTDVGLVPKSIQSRPEFFQFVGGHSLLLLFRCYRLNLGNKYYIIAIVKSLCLTESGSDCCVALVGLTSGVTLSGAMGANPARSRSSVKRSS